MAATKTFYASIESYKIEKTSEGVKISGLALPFDKVSRNGFTYIKESIIQAAPTLTKRPFLFNHNTEKVIGHVSISNIGTAGMEYIVDVNPNAVNPETGVKFAESIARGDLSNVSIQCLYDDEKSFVSSEGVTNAYINEFLELSIVTIPGFADTTASIVESFKAKGETMAKEEIKVESIPAPAPVVEQPKAVEEAPAENKPAEKSMEDRMKALEDMCAKHAAYIDACQKEKEAVEPEPKTKDDKSATDEDPVDDKEKKVEEAIRKDKAVVSTESMRSTKESITLNDVKAVIMTL